MKYKNKAIEVEAIKWDGKKLSETPKWIIDAIKNSNIIRANNNIIISTNNGEIKVTPGDYIIKGVDNELYPCKANIFNEIYELV